MINPSHCMTKMDEILTSRTEFTLVWIFGVYVSDWLNIYSACAWSFDVFD